MTAAAAGNDAGGRSRAFINGRSVTAAQLREAGDHLVDIHGQHEHQSLLRSVGASGVWQDHQTEHVLPAHTATVWMPWAFRPTHWHWLQAGWVSA